MESNQIKITSDGLYQRANWPPVLAIYNEYMIFNTRAVLSPGKHAKPCKIGYVKSVRNFTWKLCYRKDDRAMRPIRGCPENFRDSLTTPMATIPQIFHGLLFRSTLWMFLQNFKSVAFPVPEIIGVPKKFGPPQLHTPTLHLKKI